MADLVDRRPGGGGASHVNTKYVDDSGDGSFPEQVSANLRAWDATDLRWGKVPQDHTTGALLVSGAGGGGGGPATIADGADVAEGSTTDAAWVSGAGTVISLLKKIASAGGSAVSIADGADVAQGTTTDLDTASTTIGLLKKIKALLTGTLTVSGPLTDTQLRASAVPVTANAGTNLNTSALALEGGGNLAAIAGKDFATQATLALIKAKTDNIDVALSTRTKPADVQHVNVDNTVPVTDVGLSLTVDAPATSPAFVRLSDGSAAITALPVTDNAGSLTVDAPVATPLFARLSDGAAALVGQKAMASSLPVTVASDQATFPVTATAPTLTKGTQGATGYSVQRLNDAGRNVTNYFHAAPIITTVAEVMQTLTGYKSGAAVAATATPAVVTAGKTYRIERITVSYVMATVIGGALIRLRANLTGVAVIGSPLVCAWYVGAPSAFVAGETNTVVLDLPEGLEFAAGTGIAVGVIGGGAVPTTGTITGYVMLSIEGYEY